MGFIRLPRRSRRHFFKASFKSFRSRIVLASMLAISCLSFGASDDIVLAQVLPIRQPGLVAPAELAAGRAACMDYVNAHGGVAGRKLALVTKDDRGQMALTADLLRQAIDDARVVALMGPVGPASNELAVKMASAAGIVVVGPSGGDVGSRFAQSVDDSPVLFLTANQSQEAEKLASHVASLGIRRVAIISSSDREGRTALTVFDEAFGVAGLDAGKLVTVASTGGDADDAVREALKQGAPAVFLATSPRATVAVLEALASQRGTGNPVLQAYGMSSSLSPEELAHLGKKAYGLTMTQVLPPWQDVRLPLAATFREAMSDAHQTPTYASFEGCLSILAATELARRVKFGVTRGSLLKALRGMGPFPVGGFQVDPQGKTSAGSHQVEITFVSADGRLVR